MRVKYSPLFLAKVKKINVRIYKSLREKVAIFTNDPNDPRLDNHELHEEWEGSRSIDITTDWRAIYEEIPEGEEVMAYFEALGTHKELYGKKSIKN